MVWRFFFHMQENEISNELMGEMILGSYLRVVFQNFIPLWLFSGGKKIKFQQHNFPRHASKPTKLWLKREKIDALSSLSQSLHPKSQRNLWGNLSVQVYETDKHYQITNIKYEMLIMDKWEYLGDLFLKKISSMNIHVILYIQINGTTDIFLLDVIKQFLTIHFQVFCYIEYYFFLISIYLCNSQYIKQLSLLTKNIYNFDWNTSFYLYRQLCCSHII